MGKHSVEILDPSDPAARAGYEHAFYTAFSRVVGNRLIRSLWQWNDQEQRLATRIPYEDQLVYVARDEHGAIEMAIAVNVALREFQSAVFGFTPPADGVECCEFLTFFTVRDHRLRNKLRLWEGIFTNLHDRGLRIGYASSAGRLVPVYRRIGGEILTRTVVSGEERYFWRFSLDRYWMRATGQ